MEERNGNIDWLKGVCILFVIITHYSWSDNERLSFGFPFWIDMAVPLFMLISGYVYFKSYRRKNITTLDGAYEFGNIVPPFIRYTIPFLFAYAIEVSAWIIYRLAGKENISIYGLLAGCLTGGYGPGSYYYPVMLQLLLFFPFIYKFVNAYRGKSLLCFFVINIFLEGLKIAYGMPEALYRLLFFRYIFLVAFGAYCALADAKIDMKYCILGLIGMMFQIITSYMGYKPKIFGYWTGTCVIAVLYILPIFVLFLKCKEFKFGVLLRKAGQCSYNIFLTQMIYYYFAAGVVYKYISDGKIAIIINILITVSGGILFYMFENPITKRIQTIAFKRVQI